LRRTTDRPPQGPRVLLFDIETAPILAYVWSLWQNDVGLNQIHSDWFVMSWAAKWLDEPKVMYQDQRNAKSLEDDKELLAGIWKLLDEADIVVTQNGKAFDQKKLNARFIMQGFKPPSPVRHIDTKLLAKKHFAFSSNRLEYMTDKLCTKHKKLKHGRFPGFELWRQCLAGNKAAWREMERYNKADVLSLEELFHKLAPWEMGLNFNVYHDSTDYVCRCGGVEFQTRGYFYTANAKYRRYSCKQCGQWSSSKINLLSAKKKQSLRK
jgi:uncharacterized protein YprB with RNaseH-like and TPR domain